MDAHNQNESFDSSLFVGREEELRQALQWVEAGPKLISVIGSPGIGKSWFLGKLKEELTQRQGGHYWVGWWDVEDIQTVETLGHRLRQRIKHICREKNIELGLGDLVAQVGDLSRILEEEKRLRPVWIVDGIDAIPDEVFQALVAFLSAWVSRANTLARIVAAHRKDQVFGYPLNWSQAFLPLKPFPRQDGEEQLKKRHERGKGEPPDKVKQAVSQIVPDYSWGHPRLNKLFSEKPPKTSQDVHDAVKRSVAPWRLREEHWGVLCILVEQDSFSRDGFRKRARKDVGDPIIKELFDHQMLLHDEASQTYAVVPGYRECIRALRDYLQAEGLCSAANPNHNQTR